MKTFYIEHTCISCGACLDQCPERAIFIGDDQYEIKNDSCTNCGLCLGHCPVLAIKQPEH
ncbi:MAG: ferredoxin [Kiritimatiellaceae bacterium]|nr:ferredoxin [Kiritimatiellaceae bacterium]